MIFDRDNWQEIFATIRKNKLRTFLTMLGVFWGIFMLVIMLGSGNGLRNGVLKGFSGTATNSFFMWAQQTNKAYKGMKPGRFYQFNLGDFEALKQMPELEVVLPMNQLGGHNQESNVLRGLKTLPCEIQANYPNARELARLKMASGRFVNELDMKEKRKVCVIGPRVAEVLYKKNEQVLGSYIRIKGIYFKVIGTIDVSAGGDEGRDQATLVIVPFSTFQKAFNYGDRVNWFAVKVKDNFSVEAAEEKAIALIKERHKVAPDDMKAIGHWNMAVEYKKLTGLFLGIEILIWIVGSGTLIAGIIGISNIMLIVVKERTKEIGVKRAIGAVPSQIISQVLMEAVFLTGIAGYFGLVAGIALIELLNSLIGNSGGSMFTNPTVDFSIALKALGILVLGGAIAGLIPAQKAVSIKPVEALRSE